MLENKLLVLRFEILIFQEIPNYLKQFVHLLVDIAKVSPSSRVSVSSVFAVSGHNTMLYLLEKGNKKINFNKKKLFQADCLKKNTTYEYKRLPEYQKLILGFQ